MLCHALETAAVQRVQHEQQHTAELKLMAIALLLSENNHIGHVGVAVILHCTWIENTMGYLHKSSFFPQSSINARHPVQYRVEYVYN